MLFRPSPWAGSRTPTATASRYRHLTGGRLRSDKRLRHGRIKTRRSSLPRSEFQHRQERRRGRASISTASDRSRRNGRSWSASTTTCGRGRPNCKRREGFTDGWRPGGARQRSVCLSLQSPAIPEFSAEESLDELRSLATSAGAEIAGEFLQHRDRPDPATLIGKGKLEEIAGAAASVSADLILFDHDLTASQQRNIEEVVNTRVIDRTQLILDIFAKHARTREGQLQVELAQLEYMLPRLAGRGIEMSQLGGGIGTRGPGETQLETDRRKIYRRVRHVKQQMENVRRIRAQQRQRRESAPVATVALVGLHQRGKIHAVQRADPGRSARIAQNVRHAGSHHSRPSRCRRKPKRPAVRHRRISSATCRIALVYVVPSHAGRSSARDIDSAGFRCQQSLSTEQDAQVEKVLKELEADGKPRLRVMNKIDLLPTRQREACATTHNTVHVSAAKGIGISSCWNESTKCCKQMRSSRIRLRDSAERRQNAGVAGSQSTDLLRANTKTIQ